MPGLKLVCPASPSDARLLLRRAILEPNPVIFLEHKRLYSLVGDLEEQDVPLGRAKIVRPGTELTVPRHTQCEHNRAVAKVRARVFWIEVAAPITTQPPVVQ